MRTIPTGVLVLLLCLQDVTGTSSSETSGVSEPFTAGSLVAGLTDVAGSVKQQMFKNIADTASSAFTGVVGSDILNALGNDASGGVKKFREKISATASEFRAMLDVGDAELDAALADLEKASGNVMNSASKFFDDSCDDESTTERMGRIQQQEWSAAPPNNNNNNNNTQRATHRMAKPQSLPFKLAVGTFGLGFLDDFGVGVSGGVGLDAEEDPFFVGVGISAGAGMTRGQQTCRGTCKRWEECVSGTCKPRSCKTTRCPFGGYCGAGAQCVEEACSALSRRKCRSPSQTCVNGKCAYPSKAIHTAAPGTASPDTAALTHCDAVADTGSFGPQTVHGLYLADAAVC